VENTKSKQNKTPFIHPSLAAGGAQRGKSRIAPGAQKGAVVHHEVPPDVVRADLAELPRLAPPPEVVTAPEPAAADVSAAEQRKSDVVNKLLLFTQPLVKSVEIGGMTFRFKLPTPSDSAHVNKIFSSFPESEQTVLKSRILSLSAALLDIDGVSLESIYSGQLTKDLVLMRYSELMKWSNPVLNGVIAAYEKILDDVRQEYLPDFLKQPKEESTG
jgi:hypothetical protein